METGIVESSFETAVALADHTRGDFLRSVLHKKNVVKIK